MQENGRGMDRALRALAGRPRSEKEIVDRLSRAGCREAEIADTLEKLAAAGLLDDGAFANQWAAGRARKGLGPRRIAWELRQKGIAGDTLEAALAGVDEEAALTAATALAGKYLRQGGANAQGRALAALSRRGFGYAQARQALERARVEAEGE